MICIHILKIHKVLIISYVVLFNYFSLFYILKIHFIKKYYLKTVKLVFLDFLLYTVCAVPLVHGFRTLHKQPRRTQGSFPQNFPKVSVS